MLALAFSLKYSLTELLAPIKVQPDFTSKKHEVRAHFILITCVEWVGEAHTVYNE